MKFSAKTFTTILTAINLLLLYEAVKAEECETLSIREYEHLQKLQNCTVILGNLDVMFFNEENYTAEEVNRRTFPLREVTGFMFITGLPHVDSLGQLFPNLTIIRGQKLFFNYAFIIYDTGLKEISLRNLLKISRGSVRIDGNNSRLCLSKIDWDSIIVSGKLIVGKTLSQDCSWLNLDRCASCPEKMCWNNKACQRFESSFLPKPPYTTKRCHPLCLGGCVSTDTSAKGCYTCRDISDNSECVESCSDNKLLHVETRRCISVDECKLKNRTIHESSCLQACPPGFSTKVNATSEAKSYKCEKCTNNCPKFCEPPEIRTISQLEAIGYGCTVITGSLEINMYEDISNVTAELNTYLGNVEEIRGTLRIHRSSPITELTFLNRLRVIHGNNKTAIQIFENQNLQTIFDWQKRGNMKLKVKRGNVLIYNNILLCQNETRRFEEILSRTPYNSDLIHNNGAKNKCALPTIEVGFKVWSHESVAVRWKDVNTKLKRRFNAYIIQYVSMETSNVLEDKLLLERDSCSSYGWQHTFVRRDDCRDIGNGYLEYNITGLEQFTFYALSIQTYHYGADDNDSPLKQGVLEHDGEISAVKTFQTLLKIPSRVRNLRTKEKSPVSIELQWDVALSEQSAIKFFYIDVIEKPFNKTLIDRRNYCTEPIEASENDEYMETFNTDSKSVANPFFDLSLSCCDQCCQMRQDFKKNFELEDIDFQANLVKYSEEGPRRTFQPRLQSHRKFVERSIVPSSVRTYLVQNLQPFTHYTFYLHACLSDELCGDFEFLSEMTTATLNQSYDRVKVRPSKNIFEEKEFHVYLEEPALANGVIIKYIAEFWQVVSNLSVRLEVHCITRKELQLNESRYSVDHLVEGVYMFRVMAISLASMGPFSEFHEFQIVKPDKSLSKGWIYAFVFMFLLAASVAAVSYYYKHKFFIMKRGQNDRMILMKDIEPTDFNAIANNRHQRDFDELSDIMEFDE